MVKKLAFYGGKKIRSKVFPINNTIDKKEIARVNKILKSGILSDFLASSKHNFYGGTEVKKMEKNWARFFKSKYAVSVSSWSLGIQTMIGALNVSPGDEIIMSPFTMSSCAASCLFYGVVPIFADVEKDYFCIDPEKIEKKINSRTKAIMAINIFGQSCDYTKLRKICKKHNLHLIEDAAQSIGGKYRKSFLGNMGDIGGFSLNYHKHIHCGEGGVILTDNKKLYQKSCLIRNHGEYFHDIYPDINLTNVVGSNYRLVEPMAAIADEQLKKLNKLLSRRIKNSHYLIKSLRDVKVMKFPGVRKNTKHSFYVVPFLYQKNEMFNVDRDQFIKMVKKELPNKNSESLILSGYVKPIYLQKIYQKKIGLGKNNFPFSINYKKNSKLYKKGNCPIAEKLYEKNLILLNCNHPFMLKKDLDDIIKAFKKVYNHILNHGNFGNIN